MKPRTGWRARLRNRDASIEAERIEREAKRAQHQVFVPRNFPKSSEALFGKGRGVGRP
jgi:hypothetical protein